MTTTQPFDQVKADAFAERMLGVLNGAGVKFLTSVAYRTGLLEALATLPPSTSEEIATARVCRYGTSGNVSPGSSWGRWWTTTRRSGGSVSRRSTLPS